MRLVTQDGEPPRLAVDGSEEIFLRILHPNDAQAVFDLINGERSVFEPWFPWIKDLRTPDDFREIISTDLSRFSSKERLSMGVWRKGLAGASDVLLGIIRIPVIEDGVIAEITRLFGKCARGNGVVTGSCVALFDFLFGSLGIHRIESYCSPENKPACGSLKKLGFTYEGTRKEALLSTSGGFADLMTWRLLRNEWEVHRQRVLGLAKTTH